MGDTSSKPGFGVRTRRFARIAYHGLAVIGLVAVALLALQGGRLFAQDPARSAAMGPIRYDPEPLVVRMPEGEVEKHRALASYLSRKYRVAAAATEEIVSAAYQAGRVVGLDPLLIIAVMAIESRLNPIAESEFGAMGLMQVIPKFHADKLSQHGGEDALLEPVTNILLGARILKEYIGRGGSLESGLQLYAGAVSDVTSQYAQKVIAEKERLQHAVRRVRTAAAGAAA